MLYKQNFIRTNFSLFSNNVTMCRCSFARHIFLIQQCTSGKKIRRSGTQWSKEIERKPADCKGPVRVCTLRVYALKQMFKLLCPRLQGERSAVSPPHSLHYTTSSLLSMTTPSIGLYTSIPADVFLGFRDGFSKYRCSTSSQFTMLGQKTVYFILLLLN